MIERGGHGAALRGAAGLAYKFWEWRGVKEE